MKLKRLYDHDAPPDDWAPREEQCSTCQGKGVVINETLDGVVGCPDCKNGVRTRYVPPVIGVEVLHAGPRQKFSTRIIEQGKAQGWLQVADGELAINGANKQLTYRIRRRPGFYCCHCGSRLDAGGSTAEVHLQNRHPGEKSPDPDNPSGYEQIHYYDCELVKEA